MDTKLNLNADEGSHGNRELVTPVSVEQRSAGARPMRVKASSDSLRRVRIAVGEYARTSGMYDPVDVVVFTKMCIHEARARVPSAGLESSDALLKEALKVAAASCGVCHRQFVDTTGEPAATHGIGCRAEAIGLGEFCGPDYASCAGGAIAGIVRAFDAGAVAG